MGKYGEVAILAVRLCVAESGRDPVTAWNDAASRIFPHSESLREKNCPQSAFLGLCEASLIEGIPSGQYTKSADNKAYAIAAVDQLRDRPDLTNDRKALWELVIGDEDKVSNSQMDVVRALWGNGMIANG